MYTIFWFNQFKLFKLTTNYCNSIIKQRLSQNFNKNNYKNAIIKY